jgi:signal transduction histidine kinase
MAEPVCAEQRSRFFERFHRGDSACSRKVDGHGLGLNLVREIAPAHGGKLGLAPSPADEVRLTLHLPIG